MTPARGRALAGALALSAASAVWTLAGAAPAGAYVCTLGLDTPAAGSISGSPDPHVTGPFAVRHGAAERSIEVTFTKSPGAAPAGVTRSGAAVGPADRFDVPVGPLTRNGRYTALVRARHSGTSPVFNCSDGIGAGGRDTERTAEVSFGVSVRALPPGNVAGRFDAGPRTVVLSWDASSDPDVAGYTISRAVGGEAPTSIQVPPDPHSWTDSGLPGTGATIAYTIQASRVGPDPDTSSEPSPPVTVQIQVAAPPAVPPSTTTTAPGPSPSPSAGRTSTPTTVPFVLGLPVSGTLPEPAAPGTIGDSAASAPEDGSYQPLLPYEPRSPGDGGLALSESDPAVVGDAQPGGGGDGPPQLGYVASALLSSVVAAHVLWLRKQALRPEAAGSGEGASPLPLLEPVSSRPADAPPASSGPSPFAPPGLTPDGVDADLVAVPGPQLASTSAASAAAASSRVGGGSGAGAILRPSRDGSGAFEPVGIASPDDLPREAPVVAAAATVAVAARRRRPLRSADRPALSPTARALEADFTPAPPPVRRRRPLRSPTRSAPVGPDEAPGATDPSASGSPSAAWAETPGAGEANGPLEPPRPPTSVAGRLAPTQPSRRRRPLRSPTRPVAAEPVVPARAVDASSLELPAATVPADSPIAAAASGADERAAGLRPPRPARPVLVFRAKGDPS